MPELLWMDRPIVLSAWTDSPCFYSGWLASESIDVQSSLMDIQWKRIDVESWYHDEPGAGDAEPHAPSA